MFKDIHISSKLLCLVLCFLSVCLLDFSSVWLFLLFLSLILFQDMLLFLVEVLFFTLYFTFFPAFYVLKAIFLVLVILFFARWISFLEVVEAVEILCYKIVPSKVLYMILSWCYFVKIFKSEFSLKVQGFRMLGRKIRMKDAFLLLSLSVKGTRKECVKVLNTLEYRFYHVKRSRTKLEGVLFTSLDRQYIVVSIILFLTIYIGR